MHEQGSPLPDRSPSILIASGPQDEQAIALVQTLRAVGLHVLFADTVALATRAADEGTACVAVLRPDTWKAQTIATIMRAKPACLIPVLAEPMELPRGPWTSPAIDFSTQNDQGTQELIQMLRDYLATSGSRPITQKSSLPFTPGMLQFKPRRRKLNVSALLSTIILMLLILGLGGLLAYHYYTHPSTLQSNVSNTLSTPHYDVYSAAVPGPNCSVGAGQWATGEHYIKTVNKKQVEVLDKYTTLQCQSDGALVTRTGDYDVYSELFFNGPSGEGSLAGHYFAQVNATILSGDAQADVTMDAHVQANTYGRYSFDINTLGHWEASIGSSSDGSSINRMAIGFLPKASKTYTLATEVNGPTMTFFINGTQVTTVTDTTYAESDSVAFGISDNTASAPVSALFSNFQYKALPPTTLTSAQAVATATVRAQSTSQTPYTARVPGDTCDKGAGQWQPITDTENTGASHCQANGMQLVAPANAKTITQANFYWLNGHFPQNYKVSAQIDVSAAGESCAGLATRTDTNNDNYAFIICPDGSWSIVLITDTFHTLAQGTTSAQNTYTITAESNGSAQSLYIGGQLIKTVNNKSLTSTDHISLDTGLYTSNQDTSAMFSNFTFTPLP